MAAFKFQFIIALTKKKHHIIYSFVKLIRIENLLLMALVLYVSNQYIFHKESFALTSTDLMILILSTTFIAAGGYVINDYFDLKIDKINRPESVVIEKTIHRKAAILWHLFFSAAGIAGGIFLAFRAGHLSLSAIQLFSIIVLLIYPVILKKIFIAGNITIAVLSGLLPILPYIYVNVMNPSVSILTAHALLSLSAFAFFTTLIRELIKDIEDMTGDAAGNRKTIPVVWGLLASKIIAFFLMVLLIIFLIPFVVYYYIQHQTQALMYNILLLIFPSIISIVLILIFNEPKKFGIVSVILKLIMLSGIVFYLIF